VVLLLLAFPFFLSAILSARMLFVPFENFVGQKSLVAFGADGNLGADLLDMVFQYIQVR
jgi:hypothetical protein